MYKTPVEKRIYIHCPALENTKLCLKNIQQSLESSGLINEKIICCCDASIVDLCLELFPSATIRAIENIGKFYEYPTLENIWVDSNIEEFYCLYIHAKGASKSGEELENAIAWQNVMLHGVSDNYQTCIDHLDNGADIVGSMWYWHFKGNFWWGKSSHLKHMPQPSKIMFNRYDAEYWCCLGLWWDGFPKPASKNLFYLQQNLEGEEQFKSYLDQYGMDSIDTNQKLAFVDSRLHEIDGLQKGNITIEEFFNVNHKCAFDQIHIPDAAVASIKQCKDFLNYDGSVFLYSTSTKNASQIGWQNL
jgi:hypothetical protein